MYEITELLVLAYAIREYVRATPEMKKRFEAVADWLVGDTVGDEHEYADNLVLNTVFNGVPKEETPIDITHMTKEELNALLDSVRS